MRRGGDQGMRRRGPRHEKRPEAKVREEEANDKERKC